MVVRALGDHIEAARHKHRRHGACIGHDLLLVGFELRLQRFLEGHRLGGNHMLQRATLNTGENRRIDLLFDLSRNTSTRLAEDDAATRAAQGLVRGGSHHIGKRQRAWVHACCDQTGHMRHVHQEVRAHFIGNRTETRPVDHARIGRKARDNQLRLVLTRQGFNLRVVNLAGFRHQAVLYGVIALAGEIHLGTVGQMPTMRQRHAKHGITRLHQRQEHCTIGL